MWKGEEMRNKDINMNTVRGFLTSRISSVEVVQR